MGFLSQSFPLKEFKDVPDCEKKTRASCRGATGFSPEELLPVAAVQQPFPLSSASLVDVSYSSIANLKMRSIGKESA